MSTFFSTLEKIGYNLNELELFLGMRIVREIIYYGISPEEKFITSFLKIGGPEKVVKLWLRLIQTDHSIIHKHVDPKEVEKQLFSFIKTYLINYFKEDTLIELGRIP